MKKKAKENTASRGSIGRSSACRSNGRWDLVVKSIYLLFILAFSVTATATSCEEIGDLGDYSDAQLEEIFNACSYEIESQKQELGKKQEETASISRDISILQSQINRSNSQIKARSIEIYRMKNTIKKQSTQIELLEENIDQSKASIQSLLRTKNQLDDYSYVEVFFSNKTVSEFFKDIDSVSVLELKITDNFQEFTDLKNTIEGKQDELAEQSARERELISQKQQEVVLVSSKKLEQGILLAESKKEENEYKTLIAEKEAIKAKIRGRIFEVASGEKISFGDALTLVQPYESELGIDAAFLLAILFQESGWKGKIGGNIGQCKYNQYNRHGNDRNGYEVMSASQQSSFLKIISGIDGDAATVPVSCPIPSDGSYGGAMGPAQFMPKTWLSIRGAAAKILGKAKESLSPFANQDAFIASGTYLRDLYYSKGCRDYANKYAHISPEKTLRERCAAAKYYAGGNWWKFRMKYGEPVVQRANRFRADIATLGN